MQHIPQHLIKLNDILLSDEEFNETKNNNIKENETLLKLQKIFKDTVDTLTRKFNDIMAYKFLCLKYKDNEKKGYTNKDISISVDNSGSLNTVVSSYFTRQLPGACLATSPSSTLNFLPLKLSS